MFRLDHRDCRRMVMNLLNAYAIGGSLNTAPRTAEPLLARVRHLVNQKTSKVRRSADLKQKQRVDVDDIAQGRTLDRPAKRARRLNFRLCHPDVCPPIPKTGVWVAILNASSTHES